MSTRNSLSCFGYRSTERAITIREDAPLGLRQFIVQVLYELGYLPSYARRIICRTLRVAPDNNNWSEHPNIEYEVNQLIQECEWFSVYDIIEAFGTSIDAKHREGFSK